MVNCSGKIIESSGKFLFKMEKREGLMSFVFVDKAFFSS